MKKIIFLLMTICSINIFALDGYGRIGVMSNYASYNKEEKSFENYSPTVGFELTQDLLLVDAGVGVAYNHRTNGTEISTVPVYGVVRWNLLPVYFEPYLVLKYGYAAYTDSNLENNNDPKANTYYGAGIGLKLDVLQAELLYSKTKIKDDLRGKDDLDQITLSLGYQFF